MTPAERAEQERRDAIARLLAAAPKLSEAQRDRLAGLLRPAARQRRKPGRAA